MPRDRRPLDVVARTVGVPDRRLRQVAGEDDEAGPELETSSEISKELRRRWPTMSLDERQRVLRLEVATKFRKRFGREWDERRAEFFRNPNWPPAREHWQKRRGQGLSSRSRLVMMLDYENQLWLPRRRAKDQAPRGSDEPRGPSRFLSVLEMTWVSLLCGHWPEAAKLGTPDEVLRAERTAIKDARDRHGQRQVPGGKLMRGPRKRAR